jgi:hypothetical protein
MRRRSVSALAAAVVAVILAAGSVAAAVGQPRTAGPQYDRNPSVVSSGGITYLFFARSRAACDRLAGCNPDNATYDIFVKKSANGGKDYGPATLAATNPNPLPTGGIFRGRTIAATVGTGGAISLYWADGGFCNTMYHVAYPGSGVGAVTPVTTAVGPVFNVEAVTRVDGTFVYTEECGAPYGIHSYRAAGPVLTGGTLVAADRNLPKAIVDDQNGSVRLTYVDATAYPVVDVYVRSSADGLVFGPEQPVVHEAGVANWDPQLVQKPNGDYELHFAPDRDEGAGSQRIAVTLSPDFVHWSAPHEVTPGVQGGVRYWDYWPEAVLRGNQVVLYYASERGIDTLPAGTGHLWSDPGFSGVNGNDAP